MVRSFDVFILIGVFIFTKIGFAIAQDYEVADIDCAVGAGGKELLTARLRRPEGFRGTPIFADDRGRNPGGGGGGGGGHPQDLMKDSACQIFHDVTDTTSRVFVLRVTDFSQCGVLKRNGFIHLRVWFPQLPGVVMLSDQEVIIMCKPPQPTITQSKAAGFAGSIPSGARVSGIVEESPGRLEYEVALFRESSSSSQGRSATGAGAYITGVDAQELPVDQAVPIGTRLQLRAKINPDSSWQHAKLMEVSVSPDPKDGSADGSVALIKDGCRNPDLVSIIPKQPYRFKDKTNEVVLDFEAFLLSNMGDRNTLWLHTQIKACMESQDCHPEFCMDVYQPSGFGRKRRDVGLTSTTTMVTNTNGSSSVQYVAPLSQHWRTVDGESTTTENGGIERPFVSSETQGQLLDVVPPSSSNNNIHNISTKVPPLQNHINVGKIPSTKKFDKIGGAGAGAGVGGGKKDSAQSTKFGENIGFSVIMPAEYYRNAQVVSPPFECRGWATAALFSLLGALVAGTMTCVMSHKLRKYSSSEKDKALSYIHSPIQTPITIRTSKDATIALEQAAAKSRGKHDGSMHHHHHSQLSQTKYARDSSIYRS